MQADIKYPAEVEDDLERSLHPTQMQIKLRPSPDFKGGNDGNLLNQLLNRFDTNGDVIEIVLRDSKGNEKFKVPARLSGVSTTMGTLLQSKEK